MYPIEALENDWQGTVYVKFVITIEGKLINAEVAESSGYKVLDNAGLKVFKQLTGKWEPGYNAEGQAVPVQLTLPVNFRIG